MNKCEEWEYGCCGECKYHAYEEIDRGFVCTNTASPYCTDWTDYTDTCPEFEKRGKL